MLILPLQFAPFIEGCGYRLKLVCKLTNLSILAPVVDATSLAVGAFVLQRFGALKSNILSPSSQLLAKNLFLRAAANMLSRTALETWMGRSKGSDAILWPSAELPLASE